MKDLSVYIYEANGYSAILTTINEWIYMSHKAHDTILYCAIGRDDEDKDGYILRVNIAEKPYQIDAFHLSDCGNDLFHCEYLRYEYGIPSYYRWSCCDTFQCLCSL